MGEIDDLHGEDSFGLFILALLGLHDDGHVVEFLLYREKLFSLVLGLQCGISLCERGCRVCYYDDVISIKGQNSNLPMVSRESLRPHTCSRCPFPSLQVVITLDQKLK